MINRLAVLLLVLAIAGCGDRDERDGRPESVPVVGGLWREGAGSISRNECTGFAVPASAACLRTVAQHKDQLIVTDCEEGGSFFGSAGLDGRMTVSTVRTRELEGSCSLEVDTTLDVYACDIGPNETSQGDATRLLRFRPSGNCALPPTCVGAGRGRPCASDADCPGTGRCNSAPACIGGENDNAACADDGDCPGGACSQPTCAGGDNDGAVCSSSAQCPGGACSRPICVGGTDDGQVCESSSDCPAGSCSKKIEACTVVMGSIWTRRPGICIGGPLDGQTCAGAADCRPGVCSTNVCIGGARDSLACALRTGTLADTNCPVACVGGVCAGGANSGETCSSDTDCPLFACTSSGRRFCNTGPRENLSCQTGDDCPCATLQDCPAPASRCVIATSCTGGLRQNQRCLSAADCTVFTCGSAVCAGGGQACSVDADCGEGDECIDRPFCEGGSRNGMSCDGDGDCPGDGQCLQQARACSSEIDVE